MPPCAAEFTQELPFQVNTSLLDALVIVTSLRPFKVVAPPPPPVPEVKSISF